MRSAALLLLGSMLGACDPEWFLSVDITMSEELTYDYEDQRGVVMFAAPFGTSLPLYVICGLDTEQTVTGFAGGRGECPAGELVQTWIVPFSSETVCGALTDAQSHGSVFDDPSLSEPPAPEYPQDSAKVTAHRNDCTGPTAFRLE